MPGESIWGGEADTCLYSLVSSHGKVCSELNTSKAADSRSPQTQGHGEATPRSEGDSLTP